jgi:hypothetical protein
MHDVASFPVSEPCVTTESPILKNISWLVIKHVSDKTCFVMFIKAVFLEVDAFWLETFLFTFAQVTSPKTTPLTNIDPQKICLIIFLNYSICSEVLLLFCLGYVADFIVCY